MGRAAAHRGQVSETYTRGAVGLECRDLDSRSCRQNLQTSEDGRLSVVLTGHIYNRQELAAELGSRVDRASHPSQLVLAAYRAWGSDCVARLDGDFAFVLHDETRRGMLCARDPLGVLPLHYAVQGDTFLAASEPKQLLAAGVSDAPCEVTIAGFLTADSHLTGGPRSFYEEVWRLEPAHWAWVDAQGVKTRQYWKLDPEHRIEERDEDLVRRVRALILDSVDRRMPADGPYGAALSGGFDSTSVVGAMHQILAARASTEIVKSFSFELRDLAADEPELISAVSSAFSTEHHRVFLDRDNAFEILPELCQACDQPALDMGLLYLWRKKQMARGQGVRQVLSGLGGDELFYGSYYHFADLLRQLRLLTLWQEVKGVFPIDPTTGLETSWKTILMYSLAPLVPRRIKWGVRRAWSGSSMGRWWIDSSLMRRVDLVERMRQRPAPLYRDAYRQRCYEVFQSPLVSCTLPLHEAMGAALGVETRFPLLDRRIVEFMFAVPRRHKICRGRSRILQRKAMAGILPDVVLEDHKKKNINIVLRRQQRNNFRAEVEKVFARKNLRCESYFDHRRLLATLERFRSGRYDDVTQFVLWAAVSLERWLEYAGRPPGGGAGGSDAGA